MSDFLFVAQEMLDNWMMSGKIDFSGHVMTIRGDRRSYVLEPALRFVRVLGDEADEAGLLGKVKTEEQVAAGGGEHYEDSVILNDVAYEVQMGFVAKVTDPAKVGAGEGVAPIAAPAGRAAQAQAAATPPPEQLAQGGEQALAETPAAPVDPEAATPEPKTDAQMLTEFLLRNLK